MNTLEWKAEAPEAAGYYWYRHTAADEHPALVRVARIDGELRVYFAGMPAHAPMRMLTGGRWTGPVARPQ